MKKNSKLPRGIFRRGANQDFWIRYKDQRGKIHRQHIGPFLEPAKRAVEKRRSEVVEGTFFPEKIKARILLFGEISKEYLKLAKGRKRTWRDDEDHLEALKALNDVPIADLTAAGLEAVISDLAEEREWAPGTFNRYRTTLSGVFKSAMKAGKAQANPARDITHRREENTRSRFLSDEEEAALMKVVREEAPEREVEILVGLHSGMRRSEQYRTAQVPDGGLKWEHVNLRSGVIRLPRSKSGKPRHVKMNSILRRTVASIPRVISSPFIFSGEPDKWFAYLREKAKIKDFTWHDLRHTFGSRLAMAGVHVKTIADLMGHSSIMTTMRYMHLAPEYLDDAVELLVQSPVEKSTRSSTRSFAASGDDGK